MEKIFEHFKNQWDNQTYLRKQITREELDLQYVKIAWKYFFGRDKLQNLINSGITREDIDNGLDDKILRDDRKINTRLEIYGLSAKGLKLWFDKYKEDLLK